MPSNNAKQINQGLDIMFTYLVTFQCGNELREEKMYAPDNKTMKKILADNKIAWLRMFKLSEVK